MRPGIVIVTFNSESVIGSCLRAAVRQDADIVVVDNASNDGTVEEVRRWPEVELIANGANAGFAAAVNQGVRRLRNEVVLLLNPDAVVETGLTEMAAQLREPEVAAVGGRLLDGSGEPQTGFAVRRFPTVAALAFEAAGLNRVWPGNPVNRSYRCLDMDLNSPADVDQPAGAFLMIRRDVWRDLNGLDEGFHPLWFEDVDYLKRVCDLGFKVRYLPAAAAVHAGGHSIRGLSDECRELYWYGSLLRYASKHFGFVSRRVICVAVLFGSLLRMPASVMRKRRIRLFGAYGGVIRLAAESLVTGRVQSAGRYAAAGTTS